MDNLDSIIENRLVVKDKRYRLQRLGRVFALLFIVLMILLGVILHVMTTQSTCTKLTSVDMLQAKQLYLEGDLSTADVESLVRMYLEDACV